MSDVPEPASQDGSPLDKTSSAPNAGESTPPTQGGASPEPPGHYVASPMAKVARPTAPVEETTAPSSSPEPVSEVQDVASPAAPEHHPTPSQAEPMTPAPPAPVVTPESAPASPAPSIAGASPAPQVAPRAVPEPVVPSAPIPPVAPVAEPVIEVPAGRTMDADPTMADIDREVAEAMSDMGPQDLAELSGDSGQRGSIGPGAELTGTVAGVDGDDVFIEFGVKSQGILPRNQFGKKEAVEVGRRVDVVVERYDRENDLWIVARKGAIQRATWTTLTVGMPVEGKVTGLIKGGLEIDLQGIRAFMPGSHVDIAQMKDISVLLNQRVKCEVMEIDRRRNNVLVSRRKLLERERAESREALLEELAPGQRRKGVVGNITDFGAFVDLGGVDGLLHIADLSWGQVEKVSDVVSTGQEVEVLVLKIDRKRNRISLGLKQALPDPWDGVADRYPSGSSVSAKVVRLADFGAFAELEEGVDGLIPVSEMSWSRVNSPSQVVSVGDTVKLVVLDVDPRKRRIALSLKQAEPDPWESVLESFEPNSLVKGKVTRLADFGAFVELVPGVEGLVHISEMSTERVRSCGDVVQPGQEIETRVLGIDRESRRISLSIKAVKEPVEIEAPSVEEAKRPKKRKKPLRGGLSDFIDW